MATRGWDNAVASDVAMKRAQKRQTLPQERRSKYRAVRCEVAGRSFDSKAEGRRYAELLQMGKLGVVRNLELQPTFPIVLNGSVIAIYRADFRYEYEEMEWGRDGTCWLVWSDVIEDVKGFKTPVYRLKKKLVEAQYGIQIREVR